MASVTPKFVVHEGLDDLEQQRQGLLKIAIRCGLVALALVVLVWLARLLMALG